MSAPEGSSTTEREAGIEFASMPMVPCPFCGHADPGIDEVAARVWAAVCEGCGAIGPFGWDEQTGKRAIEVWNQRDNRNG